MREPAHLENVTSLLDEIGGIRYQDGRDFLREQDERWDAGSVRRGLRACRKRPVRESDSVELILLQLWW